MIGIRAQGRLAALTVLATVVLATPTVAGKKDDAKTPPPAATQAGTAAAAAPGSPTGPAAGAKAVAANASPSPSSPVAMLAGVSITLGDLDEHASGQLLQLRAQEYDIRRRALEEMIGGMLLEKEAAARKISVEELSRVEIEAKAAPVVEEEKRSVYEANKQRISDKPEAEALKMIEQGLRQQHMGQRSEEFLGELRSRANVKVLLEPPRIPVEIAGNDPVKGPKEASVTIVEFSDFQCPYCSRVTSTLRQLQEMYGERVRLVFRDFPLPIHAQAPKAAEAGDCANEQGKFWAMHDKLFDNQAQLDVESLKKRAAEIGLDAEQFVRCLDSGKYALDVRKDVEDGEKHGVQGTPTFFINGRPLVGAQPLESFAEVIDEELDRVGVPRPAPPPTPKRATSTPPAPPLAPAATP